MFSVVESKGFSMYEFKQNKTITTYNALSGILPPIFWRLAYWKCSAKRVNVLRA